MSEHYDIIMDLLAHLTAAVSLLERADTAAKKAAPSDKMFDQMLADYRASVERGRAFVRSMPGPGTPEQQEALR